MFSRLTRTRQSKKEAQTILQLGDIYKALVAGETAIFSQLQMQQIIEFCFTNYRRNLLHLAVWHNQVEVLEILCKNDYTKRALIDAKDYNGDTPLHLAVYAKNFEAYKKLLQFGANTHITNNRKDRALDIIDDSPECTTFLKKINDNLSHSIPKDKAAEIQKRINKYPKISFKVTKVPEECEVNDDEDDCRQSDVDEPSNGFDDYMVVLARQTSSSRVGLIPTMSRQGSLTASRKSLRSNSSLLPNSIYEKYMNQESNKLLTSTRSLTKNLLDPNDLSSARKLNKQKSSDFDESQSQSQSDILINQFSGTSNIFELNSAKSKSSSSKDSTENNIFEV